MINQFEAYLTFENIYMWANIGVLPFWLLLIIIPNSKFTRFFTNSVIIPLILSCAYAYVIYKTILLGEGIYNIFNLFISIENLYTIFAAESFLLIFWLHFIAINLFLGSWIARDGTKYNLPRLIITISLIFVYFVGPIGLVLYWMIRIFYAKKLGFHD